MKRKEYDDICANVRSIIKQRAREEVMKDLDDIERLSLVEFFCDK